MARRLRVGHAAVDGTPARHLAVDGRSGVGPNLSHWPGNRTPPEFRADLSTEICLRFGRAPAEAREAFLGDVDVVANDHYDTDGFLSLLAILRPEVAARHEELCVAAARTGDFAVWTTPRALAVDRIVSRLADPQRSPVAKVFAGREGPEKDLARYRWLLEHGEDVLGQPEAWAALHREDVARTEEALRAALRGALERTVWARARLAVLTSKDPFPRLVLNSLAGCYRVLHVLETAAGPRYRYHDRVESWFEVVSVRPPGRGDLRRLAARLGELEAAAGGEVAWHADPPSTPVPELYAGRAAPQAHGRVSREPEPSRLPVGEVVREVAEFLVEVDERAPQGEHASDPW